MVVSYTIAEVGVVDAIVAHFSELDDTVVAGGDIQKIMSNMIEGSKDYGCYLDFGGGGRPEGEPFSSKLWRWSILGVIIIKYKGDEANIETKLRVIIDKLGTLFKDNPRLGGAVDMVRILRMDQAEPAQIMDMPCYWVPFEITAWVKG